MNIAELSQIETDAGIKFALEPGGALSVEGEDAAIDRVLAQIDRNEVAKLVRERDGSPEPIVKRVLALNVLSKETYRTNYISWYSGLSEYYKPPPAELDKMFSVIEEGWEVLFDFAHSVTCRMPNGVLVAVDRRGRVSPPSPYTTSDAGEVKPMATDQIAKAIHANLTSVNCLDSNLEPANVVDGLFAIAKALENAAFALKYLGGGENADQRGAVEFLGICVKEGFELLGDQIAEAIRDRRAVDK